MATILIIDDIAINREFLVTLLGYYQHRLLEAEDGISGLSVTRAERPDLIIADVLMPTMDGYEFVRQLRLDDQVAGTPVIFYTAHYLEKEARDLAASCAVGHVIAKPSDPEQVLRTIESALGVNVSLRTTHTGEEFDREHLRLMTDKLAEKAARLRTTNLRLDALIQLGQQLATEQDPFRLIDRYCSGIRDIVGAAFACISSSHTEDSAGWKPYFSGIDSIAGARIISLWRNHALVKEVIATREVRRLINPFGNASVLGLSADDPAVSSFVAVPVFSGTQTHGWLGLWNKLGGEGFTEEDVDLASTLCAQLAVRYENTCLYEQVRASNLSLETRVAERTRELASANAELSRSNAELEQYAFLASHDLQEPLRMMAIYSQKLLKRYRGQLDSDGELSLNYIQTGATRMRQLIDDLLKYSKMVVNPVRRELELVDLNEVVEAAKANCEAGLKESGASFLCETLPKIQGYSDQLLQVFQNLISNAIRYRRAEAALVIRIWGKAAGIDFLVAVEDNGMGLKMESAEAIFGLFLRLHGREVPGTGIGLSICKRAVENHGGRIWVESVVGQGSTFYFNLPEAHPVLASGAR